MIESELRLFFIPPELYDAAIDQGVATHEQMEQWGFRRRELMPCSLDDQIEATIAFARRDLERRAREADQSSPSPAARSKTNRRTT